MSSPQVLTKQNLVDCYIKQEYFSNKNVLFVINPHCLRSIGPTFDLEQILQIQFNEVAETCEVLIFELKV